MNPVFPLQALRAFTEVGRHGSIKLAAQALGVMEGRPALLLRRLNYDQHGRVLDLDIEYGWSI